jgi:tRNA modification GTPase
MIHDGKTIIACSSGGQANAAIAVIRLSGPFSLSDFQPFFRKPLADISPRHMLFDRLIDGDAVVDEICFCYFETPASYTGENILELYVHGNTLNVERILQLFSRLPSVRAALPGEFSLRALQNRKLSLSQVEGLDLFLNASTPLALRQGMGLLNGELHKSYLELLESFKLIKASLELLLDFHEDVGESEARAQLDKQWQSFHSQIHALARRVDPASSRLLRPEIVIAGLPNAGKSTLFNAFLAEERAIVSPMAGTTRDYLAEEVKLAGVNYRLVDTAGIRTSQDGIESQGIQRTFERLKNAFYSLLLINPLESDPHELENLLLHPFDLIVFTHADSLGFDRHHEALLKRFVVLQGQRSLDLYKDGLVLWGQLETDINKKYLAATGNNPMLVDRHKSLILNIKDKSTRVNSIITTESDLGIISHELNDLGYCVQELLGIVSPDSILDHIFANFCIGK